MLYYSRNIVCTKFDIYVFIIIVKNYMYYLILHVSGRHEESLMISKSNQKP